jgi:hypothetical protein
VITTGRRSRADDAPEVGGLAEMASRAETARPAQEVATGRMRCEVTRKQGARAPPSTQWHRSVSSMQRGANDVDMHMKNPALVLPNAMKDIHSHG